jgi:hypothetical protein
MPEPTITTSGETIFVSRQDKVSGIVDHLRSFIGHFHPVLRNQAEDCQLRTPMRIPPGDPKRIQRNLGSLVVIFSL